MTVSYGTLIGKRRCAVAPKVYANGGEGVQTECRGGGHNQQLTETGTMPGGGERQVSLQSIAGLQKAELLAYVSGKLGISRISQRG